MLLSEAENACEQKRELRKKFRALRRNMPQSEKKRLDLILQSKFLETDEYKSCKTLLGFVSLPIEVDTSLVLSATLRDGKRLALPRCKGGGQMDFYVVNSTDDLQTGAYGIREPNPETCEVLRDLEGALCLVPGLAFDRRGFRLGFGGGYYDRFLSKTDIFGIGLCCGCCLSKTLLRAEYDLPVNMIITENETIKP